MASDDNVVNEDEESFLLDGDASPLLTNNCESTIWLQDWGVGDVVDLVSYTGSFDIPSLFSGIFSIANWHLVYDGLILPFMIASSECVWWALSVQSACKLVAQYFSRLWQM